MTWQGQTSIPATAISVTLGLMNSKVFWTEQAPPVISGRRFVPHAEASRDDRLRDHHPLRKSLSLVTF